MEFEVIIGTKAKLSPEAVVISSFFCNESQDDNSYVNLDQWFFSYQNELSCFSSVLLVSIFAADSASLTWKKIILSLEYDWHSSR